MDKLRFKYSLPYMGMDMIKLDTSLCDSVIMSSAGVDGSHAMCNIMGQRQAYSAILNGAQWGFLNKSLIPSKAVKSQDQQAPLVFSFL